MRPLRHVNHAILSVLNAMVQPLICVQSVTPVRGIHLLIQTHVSTLYVQMALFMTLIMWYAWNVTVHVRHAMVMPQTTVYHVPVQHSYQITTHVRHVMKSTQA